jgi:hypothetical protein
MKIRIGCLLFVLFGSLALCSGCGLIDPPKASGGKCPINGEICCQTWDHGVDPTGNPSSAEYTCEQASSCSAIGGTPVSAGLCGN